MRRSAMLFLWFLMPAVPAPGGNLPPPYGDYEMDSSFGGGYWVVDDFANKNSDAVASGRKLVRLDNGEVIVAGLVSPYLSPDEGGGRNIGLVRYRPDGRRQAWSGSSQYLFSNNEYLIYPNSGTSHRYTELNDIQIAGDFVYVLVQSQLGAQVSSRDVHVVVFRTDGSFLGEYEALSRSEIEEGAGMALITPVSGDDHLYVAGTTYFNDIARPTLVRFTRNTDGTLTKDGGFGWAGYHDYQPPGCSTPPCASQVAGITVFRNLQGGVNRIYLGGSVQFNNNDWDFLIVAVDANGQLVGDFNSDGYHQIAIDAGGELTDTVSAIRVLPRLGLHDVYVAGNSTRNGSSRQISAMRLNPQGDIVWNSSIGGCQETGTPPECQNFRSDIAADMAITFNGAQNLLGIVGGEFFALEGGIAWDPLFVGLEADSGYVAQITRFPVLNYPTGDRVNSATAQAIVPAGPHAFALAGPTQFPPEFVTTRIVVDKLFSDRFEP